MSIEKLCFPLCGKTLNTFIPGYSDYEILCHVITKINEVIDYSKNMTIKYADPIEWDITTQYSANTVVVDGSGNAYLSVQPVPDGIQLSDTDYWTKIGNFDELWRGFKRAISLNDEGAKTTASKEYVAGELVWLNNTLYKVNTTMPIGTEFVIDNNVSTVTVEELLDDLGKDFSDKLNKEISDREEADSKINQTITEKYNDLSNKLATETTERQEGDASLNNKIDETEAELQGNIDKVSDDLEQAKKDIVEQFESAFAKLDNYANVKNYGAIGDGVTDDTQAFKDAIASGKDIFVPDGNFVITEALNIGSPLMASGGVVVAKGVTVAFDSAIAVATLHFKAEDGGHFNPVKGTVIADWFIDSDISTVFKDGVLVGFTGTILFPSKGTWGVSGKALTASTPYVIDKAVRLASHIVYDFCGGVVAFTADGVINIYGNSSSSQIERIRIGNATFIALSEAVKQYFDLKYCQRITIENLHCIGGRRVAHYIHTINAYTANIVHDTFYASAESYCSFLLDESSSGAEGISGNASIRFYNCISSFNALTGDCQQFTLYNSNDMRDVFIDHCECAAAQVGIKIQANSIGNPVWNIFIRGYVADQCVRCVYAVNLGRSQVTLSDCYFNASDRMVEFSDSSGLITNCQFIGSKSCVGVAVTNSQGLNISNNQFIDVDQCVVFSGGSACQVFGNLVERSHKYAETDAFSFQGTSNGNRVFGNSVIPATAGSYYKAAFMFASTCTGNIVGLNRVTGTELDNKEADLKVISTGTP